MTRKLHHRIRAQVKVLQGFSNRRWYPPLLGLLAALDNFVLFIPSDGILISSSMLVPRRWFSLALHFIIGSTLGALGLAAFVEYQGLPWIVQLFPGIDHSPEWVWALGYFEKYGLLCVFAICLTPISQLPVILLASMAQTPLMELVAVVFMGRALKSVFVAYLGAHAPRVLGRLWGLKGEMKDAGVEFENRNSVE